MSGLLAALANRGQVLVVPMGQVLFVNFREMPVIGTCNLGSCSVAVIASQYGAILAHISPLPPTASGVWADPYAGDNNARRMMDRVHELYILHRDFFQASNTRTYVVSAWYNGAVALPYQLAIIQDRFRQMQLEPSRHKYVVPGNRAMDGQGTVLVASPPELSWQPSVYVEDELVNGPIPWAVLPR